MGNSRVSVSSHCRLRARWWLNLWTPGFFYIYQIELFFGVFKVILYVTYTGGAKRGLCLCGKWYSHEEMLMQELAGLCAHNGDPTFAVAWTSFPAVRGAQGGVASTFPSTVSGPPVTSQWASDPPGPALRSACDAQCVQEGGGEFSLRVNAADGGTPWGALSWSWHVQPPLAGFCSLVHV